MIFHQAKQEGRIPISPKKERLGRSQKRWLEKKEEKRQTVTKRKAEIGEGERTSGEKSWWQPDAQLP